MNKEMREYFNVLNDELKEFEKNNLPVPNEIRKYQLKVNQFYMKNGIKAKQNQFTTRAKMTPDQESELFEIAEEMRTNNDVHFLADYENILKSGKFKRFGVESVDDLIDTMDMLDNSKGDELVSNILSSSQLIETFTLAKKNNISEEEMFQKIKKKYKQTGLTGSELHKSIYNSINKRKRLGKGISNNKPSNQKMGKGLEELYGINNGHKRNQKK